MEENEIPSLLPGERAGAWVREHRWVLLFALLLLVVVPMRGLWAAEESRFAMLVRGLRESGSWLALRPNGQSWADMPFLFLWLSRISTTAGDWFTGGRGFQQGVAPWALRLPTVLTSITFMFGLRRWAVRFLQTDVADLTILVLGSTPLWFWQSQVIQSELLFASLLAGAWLSWLGGYLCLRGAAEGGTPSEGGRWFLQAYGFLGLALLAEGALALLLSGLVLVPFLTWQRDWKALRQMRLGWGLLFLFGLPGLLYGAVGLQAGWAYAYAFFINQNLEQSALVLSQASAGVSYLGYLLLGCFPWCILLPALGFYIRGSGSLKSPAARFMVVAAVGPLLFLALFRAEPGPYLLSSYPFAALLMAGMLQPVAVEGVSGTRIRRLGGLLGLALAGVALTLVALAFFRAGGPGLREHLTPILGPLRLMAVLTVLGALSVCVRAAVGEGQFLVRETALTMGMLFLVGGTWGFYRLDTGKARFGGTQEGLLRRKGN